jgi:hypothetical protein
MPESRNSGAEQYSVAGEPAHVSVTMNNNRVIHVTTRTVRGGGLSPVPQIILKTFRGPLETSMHLVLRDSEKLRNLCSKVRVTLFSVRSNSVY